MAERLQYGVKGKVLVRNLRVLLGFDIRGDIDKSELELFIKQMV